VATFDFATNEYLQNLRSKFAQGEKPKECELCWKMERVGHRSRRQSAIDFFNIPEPDYEVKLESIDNSATWACNLACVICSPNNSSTWATELKLDKQQLENIGRRFQKDNNIFENFDFTTVKKIHFNGGEPLLNDHQIDLLDRLAEQDLLKNVFISYNTNGTVYPSNRIIDVWKQARLVKLFFSIDAVGPAFEYIRYPGQWDQTVNNLLTMKKELPSNVMFGFNVAVGAHNLLEVADVWNWFDNNLKTNREGDASDFCWQLTENFKIADLTLEVKQQAIEKLSGIDEFSGLVNHIKSTLTSDPDNSWITKLNDIDSRRLTNWRKDLSVAKYY
jgi:sulfatase maturation enzyme AslB (radical SAM superfamily)